MSKVEGNEEEFVSGTNEEECCLISVEGEKREFGLGGGNVLDRCSRTRGYG